MKPKQLAIAFLILAGCASQRQPPTAPALPPPALTEQVSTPALAPAPPLMTWPPRVQAAIDHHQKTGKWTTYRLPSSVLYPYDENDQPVVACAPLRTTDIQLQAGETITDVAMGDSERWIATPASSGNPSNPTPHLAVKPQMPGIETNLTIYTTVRIYHLILRSGGRAAGGAVLLPRTDYAGDFTSSFTARNQSGPIGAGPFRLRLPGDRTRRPLEARPRVR
jgi:hypothetical protein